MGKIWKLRQSPTRGWMITIGARDYLMSHELAVEIYTAHKDDIDTANAAGDRLAAENAELRKKLNESAEETRRAFNGAIKIGFDAKDMQCALSAANATLEALREVVPEDAGAWCEECCACVKIDEYIHCAVCGETPDNDTHATWFMNKLQSILYPPTKENEHDDH